MDATRRSYHHIVHQARFTMDAFVMSDKTTQQATPQKDMNRNPTGKGGFGDNPGNRNPGGWNKEMVFSYQYRRFMNMSLNELNDYRAKPDMEKKVVEELAFNAVLRAKNSLPDVKEITDRTEGKAAQSIDLTTGGESINPYANLSTEELRKLAGNKS